MTVDQIKHMVERFLRWKLPVDFNPDGGISFKAESNEHPMRHEPSGTNLLNYSQAEAMVRHMIEGLHDPEIEPHQRKPCPFDYHVIWFGPLDWRVVRSDTRALVGYRLGYRGQRFLTKNAAEKAALRLRCDVREAWERINDTL